MQTLTATLEAAQKAMGNALVKLVLTKSGQSTQTYDNDASTDRILKVSHIEQPYSQVAEVTVQNSSSNLTSLDLRGYKGVISYGYNTSVGDEYKDKAPLWVISQRLDSWQGGLACVFQLIGTPNRLDKDRASEAFTPDFTDLQTVKSLLRQIAAGGWSAWQASTAYSLDDFIIPTTSNGLVYKCTTAGTSDSSEPTWATTEGDTTSDNTATWTCEGVEIKSFNHTSAYTLTIDNEDAIIDSYKPKDSFRILINDSRLDIIKRLISYTKQAFRVEDDEELHVFLPVTTPSIVNADMELTTGWTGGGRNTTQPYSGTYSWRISNAGAPNEAYQDLTWSKAYQGKKVTFGGQAYIPSANHARLRLDDGVGTTDGSYHTGVAGHELLSVSRTFDASATRLRLTMRNENTSSAAYFDGVTIEVEYDYEYKLATSGEHTFFDKSHRKRLLIPAKITVSSHPDHPTIYTGTATDTDSNDLLSHPEYHYARLASNAEALAMAEAIRDRYLWDGEQGSGLVPMNCGQEVFDYIKFTDSRDNSDTRIGNVGYLKRTYVPGKFEMELRLGSTAFGFGDVSLPRGVGAGTRPTSGGGTDEVWDTLRKTWDFMERLVEKIERMDAQRQDQYAWMLPVSNQTFTTDISVTVTDDDDISWGAFTVNLADGRTQAVNSGSLVLTGTHYLYIIWGNRTLQNSTTYSDATRSDRFLIGIAKRASDARQKALILIPQTDNILLDLAQLGNAEEAAIMWALVMAW